MSQTKLNKPSESAPLTVFQYTRAQAIEDGVLVDLTELARESGFKVPVACTAAVWNGYVVPTQRTRALGQSERGRARNMLHTLFNAVRKDGSGDAVTFQVMFLQTPDRRVMVKLKALFGPDDRGEPAVTVMLPGEDF